MTHEQKEIEQLKQAVKSMQVKLSEFAKDSGRLKAEVTKLKKREMPKPYDDSEIRKLVNSIKIPEAFDDSHLVKMIKEIKIPECKCEKYDDTEIRKAINNIEIPEAYDDKEVRQAISKLTEKLSKLNNYNDSDIIKRLKELEDQDLSEIVKSVVTQEFITKLYRG